MASKSASKIGWPSLPAPRAALARAVASSRCRRRARRHRGAHSGALEELDDDIHAAGGKATLLTLDLRKGDQDRSAWPDAFPALGQARHFRWQRRHTRSAFAAAPRHRGCLETRHRHQSLANWRLIRTLDPLLKRSEGPRGVRHFGCCSRRKTPTGVRTPFPRPALEALVKTYATRGRDTPACASTSSTRGRYAPRCAPRPSPARTR